jgi:hypothetical protein
MNKYIDQIDELLVEVKERQIYLIQGKYYSMINYLKDQKF